MCLIFRGGKQLFCNMLWLEKVLLISIWINDVFMWKKIGGLTHRESFTIQFKYIKYYFVQCFPHRLENWQRVSIPSPLWQSIRNNWWPTGRLLWLPEDLELPTIGRKQVWTESCREKSWEDTELWGETLGNILIVIWHWPFDMFLCYGLCSQKNRDSVIILPITLSPSSLHHSA